MTNFSSCLFKAIHTMGRPRQIRFRWRVSTRLIATCLVLLNSWLDCEKHSSRAVEAIKIESLQGVGGAFKARLIDVVLEEVTVTIKPTVRLRRRW